MSCKDRFVAEAYPGFRAAKYSWRGFVTLGFFSFFVNLGALAAPLYMQQIFDRVMHSRHLETLIYLTAVFIAFLGVVALLDAIRGVVLARIGKWWDETVHPDLLIAVVETTQSSGKARNHALADLLTVRQFVGGPSVLPFFDAPWTPFFIAAIALIHPWLAVLAAAAGALLLMLALVNSYVTRARMEGMGVYQARAQATVDMATRNADSVLAMDMLPGVLKRFVEDNAQVANKMEATAVSTAWFGAFSRYVRFSAQIGVLGLGAYLATLGEMTAGGMIAASVIMGRALAPADQALGAWRAYVGARDAQARITALFREAPQAEQRLEQPAAAGALSLDAISYVQPGAEKPILANIALELAPGSVTALVGGSGSGKSTLCKLLIGALAPTSGAVRLDGAAIRNWDRAQLGRAIGYLPQSVQLLDGTVKENIARLGAIEDEAVVAAAKLAGCHAMINALPQGYETRIGDGGLALSGGQAQRIAFARALYGAPKLVVLDEPNSNLDAEGEAALLLSVKSLREQGVTVVIVSHKPSALMHVERIVTLQGGRIGRVQSAEEFRQEIASPVNDLLKRIQQKAPTA